MTDRNTRTDYIALVAFTLYREELESGDTIIVGINQATHSGLKMKPDAGHKSSGMQIKRGQE